MVKKCKFFKCLNKKECADTSCSGYGGTCHHKCGCDACLHHSYEGQDNVEICEIALSTREADMEEKEREG